MITETALDANGQLHDALVRLLACAPEIADATDDLYAAANDISEDSMLREQAAAVLQARAAIAASTKETK